MKTIYLVRHAETSWNLEGKVQGSHDTPLSIDGLAQTVKTVAFLSALRFDAIFTSPLARARAIAEPVGVNLGISPIVVPELREIEFGGWEGHTWNEIEAIYPATLAAWELKSPETRPDGGESLADVRRRAERCVQWSNPVPASWHSSSLTEGSIASSSRYCWTFPSAAIAASPSQTPAFRSSRPRPASGRSESSTRPATSRSSIPSQSF